MPCDGTCCVAFTLSKHPGELVMGPAIDDPGSVVETFTLLGMLEPLTVEQARGRRARLGGHEPNPRATDGEYFSCRHWDETTRLCSIYARRPWMCRWYPNSGQCDLGDCDCGGACTQQQVGRLHTRYCVGERELERHRRRQATCSSA
jgi:Fe-S-cluster containining protein